MTATQSRTFDEQLAYEDKFLNSFGYEPSDKDPLEELDYEDGYHNDDTDEDDDEYIDLGTENYLYDDGDYSME